MNTIFQALSSTVRRQILAYLSSTRLTASESAGHFDISEPAFSEHLSLFQSTGLIESEKKGQYV